MCKTMSYVIKLGLLALVLVGCATETSSTKIGALLPLTGDNASYGIDCRKGMELALEEHNKKQGSTIKLIIEDTRAEAKTAVTAANKLIFVDRVQAIAGDMFSSTTMAVAPIAQENGVVLVTPTASLEDIVAVGDHIFSIYPSDRYEGTLDAKQALKDGISSFAVYQQQLQVFDTMGDAFRSTVQAEGAKVPVYEVFPGGMQNFRSLLEKSQSGNYGAVYIAAYKTEAFALIKQLREIRPNIQIYSQSTLYDPQTLAILGEAGEGIIFSAPFFSENARSPVIDRFRQRFSEKYNSQPNVWAAYGYDVVKLILDSIDQSRASGVALNKVIATAKLDGVTGPTTFKPNRTANKVMRMFRITEGKFQEYQSR